MPRFLIAKLSKSRAGVSEALLKISTDASSRSEPLFVVIRHKVVGHYVVQHARRKHD